VFTAVSCAVVLALPFVIARSRSAPWAIALGVVWGGAAGNFADRLVREPGVGRGHVVDFIGYSDWFVGNVADIALVGGTLAAVLLNRGGKKSDPAYSPVPAPSLSGAPGPGPKPGPSTPSTSDPGMSEKNPLEADSAVSIKANEYSTDPDASIDIAFGVVEWDATESLKSQTNKYSWKEPPDGSVYVRVPVSITYHGKEQYNAYNLNVDYVQSGNTTSPTDVYASDEFRMQDMPRDGGTAKGYITFLLTKEQAQAKDGVWAVSALYNDQETYIKPRS